MGVITSQQQHPRIRSPSSPPDSILTNYSTNALVSASTSVVAVTEEQQQHDSVMMNLPKTNISQGIRKFSPEDTSSEITNADHELPATIVNDPSNISKMESTDEEDGEERSFDKAETNSIGSTSSSLPSLKHVRHYYIKNYYLFIFLLCIILYYFNGLNLECSTITFKRNWPWWSEIYGKDPGYPNV